MEDHQVFYKELNDVKVKLISLLLSLNLHYSMQDVPRSPFLYLKLKKQDIHQLEKSSTISFLDYFQETTIKNQSSISILSQRINTWYGGNPSHPQGPIPVGIVQLEKSYPIQPHTNLQVNEIRAGSDTRQDSAEKRADIDHATRVAGIIKSSHSTLKGIIPNVSLYSTGLCDGGTCSDNNIITAANWGLTKDAKIWNISASFYSTPVRQALDYFAWQKTKHMVFGAGNIPFGQENQCAQYPYLCEVQNQQYNALIVGAYKDGNTAGWSDDVMWNGSTWVNPASATDWELPHLTASGFQIQTVCHINGLTTQVVSNCNDLTEQYHGETGTSFAAPQVTGLSALIYSWNSDIQVWQEGVRAILLAGASHNTDGYNYYINGVDVKDGANAIDGCISKFISDAGRYLPSNPSGQYILQPLLEGIFTNNMYVVKTLTLSPNGIIRVAMAWNRIPICSNPSSGSCTGYNPNLDLDICIQAQENPPFGFWFNQKCSTSTDSTHEVFEYQVPFFTPYTNYRIVVFKSGTIPSNPSNYMGVAWDVISVPRICN